ncbi:hypothetical protein [Methanobrevibacter sp.]
MTAIKGSYAEGLLEKRKLLQTEYAFRFILGNMTCRALNMFSMEYMESL